MPRSKKAPSKMTLADVAAFAEALDGVVVGTKWNTRTWSVNDRGFAWQRPFRKADLARFGDEPVPAGDILAVTVDGLDAKDAMLEIAPPGFFTIPHFNGYAAILIALDAARPDDVRAAIEAAWRCEAARPAPRKRKAKAVKRRTTKQRA